MPDDGSKWRQRGESFRGAGLAFAIPVMLVGPPVVCTAIGYWASNKFGWSGWIYIGAIVGLTVGIRETVQIVRKLNKMQEK